MAQRRDETDSLVGYPAALVQQTGSPRGHLTRALQRASYVALALLLQLALLALAAPAGAQGLTWFKRGKLFLDPEGANAYTAALRARAGGIPQTAGDPPNLFAPASNLSTQRIGHTATKLLDGRVLVIGGFDDNIDTLASADLYDPHTNTWSPAAPMSAPRSFHTATRLPDGRVLVAGGSDDNDDSLISAEIYNPATNLWSPAAPLNTKRDTHAAVLLNNGKVLVMGGQSVTSLPSFVLFPLASAEIYDPVANTWTPTGNLSTAREAHTATLLADGKVLVVGGDTYTQGPPFVETTLATAERFDPGTGLWSSAGTMSTPRLAHTATRLLNGTVLVTGGLNFVRDDTPCAPGFCQGTFTSLASAQIYNPAANTWSAAASLPSTREDHSATLLANGQVLVVGGEFFSPTPPVVDVTLQSALLYTPTTNTWATTGAMATSRDAHTATLLGNNLVLVAGGESFDFSDSTPPANQFYMVLASAERYTPAGPSISGAPTTVAAGAVITATWSGIVSPTNRDWIGLYPVESPIETNFIDWVYVSCSKIPGAASAAGSCPFTIPPALASGFYELRLYSNDSFTRLATSLPITVAILPVVTVVATDNSATEAPPGDNGVFTVSRTGSTAAALTVNYTVSGSAANGADFTFLPGSVTIPISSSTAQIVVTPIDDGDFEGNESVIVTLSGNPAYTLGSPSSATVTIFDNETPPPTVTITATDNTATENPAGDNGVFTVTRTGSTAAPLTVNYTVGGTATNGTDYTLLSGSVIIGATFSSAPITVMPIDDPTVEGPETVIVNLSANPGVYVVGAPSSATVTINDDEPPPPTVTITATDNTATEFPAGDNGEFTVTRTGSTAAPLTVNYTVGGTAANGTDYTLLSGSVIIGATFSSAPITVMPIDDPTVEGPETVIVNLSANPGVYVVGAPSSATVTINDNDVPAGPTLTASPANIAPGGSETATWSGITSPTARDWIGLYTIGAPNGSFLEWIYVSCSKIPGAVFAAGSCPFPIPGSLVPGTYQLRMFSNDSFTVLATSNNFTVSVLPLVTITATDNTATENPAGDNGVFTVTRTGSTAAPLTVNYTVGGTATNGTDYTLLSGSVIIGATFSSAPITVMPIDDPTVEGPETVIVNLSANPGVYVVGAPSSATVTINDDEPPPPTVTITATDNTATEFPAGDNGEFTVTRTGSTAAPLTVNYTVGGTATNGTDYTLLSGSVIIGATFSSAPITVTPIDDPTPEGNETVVLTLAANPGVYVVGAPSSAAVTILDNEPTGPFINATPGTVLRGTPVTATWGGIVSPTSRDWIGLYAPAAANTAFLEWTYVSCSKIPGAATAAGSCPIVVPASIPAGTYQLRLLANDGFTVLATSANFTAN